MSAALQKKNNRRKTLAVAIAVVGVAGLSLASAAQLTLNGGDSNLVQAGTADLTATLCQASEIDVTFTLDGATPGDLGTAADFGYAAGADALLLDEIDAACAGKNLKVALGTDAGALVGSEYSASAAAGALTLPLTTFGSLTDAQVASIGQVSVTIFD